MKPTHQGALIAELAELCAEVAEIVAEAGAFDEADQVLAALVSAGLLAPEKSALGRIYMRMLGKRSDLAMSCGRKLFEANPQFFKVAFLLGQLYELAEDHNAAHQWYERSLKADVSVEWHSQAQRQFQRIDQLRRGALQAMDITSASVRA